MTSALKGVEQLEELKVSYCKNLTNTTMINIGKYASGISILYLQRCTSISDAGFAFLRNPETPLNKLTVLSLSDCSFLTDETILSLSKGCPELRALNLTFCCSLTSVALDHLVEGCQKMMSLDVSFCGAMVYDEGLEVISKGMPELERLSFRSAQANNFFISNLLLFFFFFFFSFRF
jgi:F-box/leucine-rich repeat protein 7